MVNKQTSKIIIYTDGGSRGNPGDSAIGVVIGKNEYGKYLGLKTNNQAEYEAVIFALSKVKQIFGAQQAKELEIEIRSDSQLLTNQLNGNYKIKEEKLYPLFIKIWNLKQDFKSVVFKHISREENRQADALVNKILNKQNLAKLF